MTWTVDPPGVVRASVEVVLPPTLLARGWRSATRLAITAREPVFAGHYPDFPVFPGVCLLDCVHRSARATVPPPGGELELVSVCTARFVGVVRPEDILHLSLDWQSDDSVQPHWLVAAQAATKRGAAAAVRLRYRIEPPR
jgi:3-hydroxyacyl-[acyl-carrier-protein] dehydratase